MPAKVYESVLRKKLILVFFICFSIPALADYEDAKARLTELMNSGKFSCGDLTQLIEENQSSMDETKDIRDEKYYRKIIKLLRGFKEVVC